MKRWRWLFAALLFLPLMVNAETISWTLPTTYTDGSAISTADKARITVYLRGWKAGNPTAKTYFGETRGGVVTWSDNVLVRMNEWGVTNAVPGWVPLKAGDNVLVTVSAALKSTVDNVEHDSEESAPYAWTLPGAVVVPPPPPPPPVVVPSCNPPAGISIKP